MKKLIRRVLKGLGWLVLILLLVFGISYYKSVHYNMHELHSSREDFPEVHTDKDIERLAGELVAQMTLEEKIDQMYGETYWQLPKLGLNFLIRGRFPHVYVGRNERLNIPPWVLSDGPRGARVMDKDISGVTVFPVAMARGASWDVDLERRVHEAIAIEMRANKTNYAATPCINLLRHPAWGRAQETYGEDPWLLGAFGVAAVKGIEKHNVMACPKHFALNSLENSRLYVDVELDERTLREVYLPHFKRTVQEGKPASIMSAYNSVRGEYCPNNAYLLQDILRDEWGFEGFVTSDWVMGTRDGIGSVKAGLEVEMPFQRVYSYETIGKGIEDGLISEADIDKLVTRSLRTRLKYAFAKDSMEYGKDRIACEEHVALARESAEKSMVLLKNEQVLPFEAGSGKKVLVLGRLADLENTGDHASSDATPAYVVTPYAGIRDYNTALGNEVELYDGPDLLLASEKASKADQVIVVVGYTYAEEGEHMNILGKNEESAKAGQLIGRSGVGGDRESLSLPSSDEELIRAVAGKNPNTVVVYIGGSAINMNAWENEVPAILFAWYNGMEGGNALARILYGKVNPSGKLPFTIARNDGDYPYFTPYTLKIRYDYYHGYTLFEKRQLEVHYPFGYGLSYTRYTYDNLQLEQDRLQTGDLLRASVDVTNAGDVSGEEVVQLYVGFGNSSVDRPVKLLRAFEKVHLEPGETRRLHFEVPVKDLAWYDDKAGEWKIEEMEYELYLGASSRKEDLLRTSFSVVSSSIVKTE